MPIGIFQFPESWEIYLRNYTDMERDAIIALIMLGIEARDSRSETSIIARSYEAGDNGELSKINPRRPHC
jgi:hypothetical protein